MRPFCLICAIERFDHFSANISVCDVFLGSRGSILAQVDSLFCTSFCVFIAIPSNFILSHTFAIFAEYLSTNRLCGGSSRRGIFSRQLERENPLKNLAVTWGKAPRQREESSANKQAMPSKYTKTTRWSLLRYVLFWRA